MMIFKGFCIGFVCLVLGAVIGYQGSYFVAGEMLKSMSEGVELGKKMK